jgi:hypothetical protein
MPGYVEAGAENWSCKNASKLLHLVDQFRRGTKRRLLQHPICCGRGHYRPTIDHLRRDRSGRCPSGIGIRNSYRNISCLTSLTRQATGPLERTESVHVPAPPSGAL